VADDSLNDEGLADEARPDDDAPGPLDGAVGRVVSWLRAGYPDGVPQQDYVALLGLLQRKLTDTEVEDVVLRLTEDVASNESVVNRGVIEARMAEVLKGPPLDEDIARVSARLASAGWPLAPLHPDAAASHEGWPAPRRNLVERVVDWLRQGYPTGLPEHDYIALVALLRRRLTDAEVVQVSAELVRQGVVQPDRVDIGTAITRVTSELPADEDVERVRRYLDEHGWPTDLSL
jgi:uncharacterized protein YcgL (UPF0745 family)